MDTVDGHYGCMRKFGSDIAFTITSPVLLLLLLLTADCSPLTADRLTDCLPRLLLVTDTPEGSVW